LGEGFGSPPSFSTMQMSPAEIFDKASILKVKIKRLPNGHKLVGQFAECLAEFKDLDQEKVWHYLHELYRANDQQFVLNDALFAELEKPAINTGHVTGLIAKAHAFNKIRIQLKNEIAAEFGGHREEKSFDTSL
jgi:hypothetical protein